MKKIVASLALFAAVLAGSLSLSAAEPQPGAAGPAAAVVASISAPAASACPADTAAGALAFLEPEPTALACQPAVCRAECRDECKAIGCFPDCILSTCECYCNC